MMMSGVSVEGICEDKKGFAKVVVAVDRYFIFWCVVMITNRYCILNKFVTLSLKQQFRRILPLRKELFQIT